MPDLLCLDSSVAAKWVFAESLAVEAKCIQTAVRWRRMGVVVPDSFFIECVSVAYHKLRQGLANREQATRALRILHQTPARVVAVGDLGERVLAWASDLGVSAWDAAYLAVAEQEQCELWTADKELAYRARQQIEWVRLLGEDLWPEPEAR